MKIIGRIAAFIIGLIGVIIAFFVNLSYSAFHRAVGVLGDASLDKTHGFIGFLLVIVGLIGSVMALFAPVPAAVLLLIAGIGLFFVVKGFAVLSILFFVVAAALAYVDRSRRKQIPRIGS